MKLSTTFGALVAAVASTAAASDVYVPPQVTIQSYRQPQQVCNHPIYCNGPILERVQLSGVFDKDKTFIDMPTRKPVKEVVAAFDLLPENATKETIAMFVDDNFYPIGYDIVEAELEDWTEDPPFLRDVTDPVLRGYGMSVHKQWKKLARRQDVSKLCKGCESSLIPTNNVFIVPGGNTSREFRYWNSYHINLGLLKSGLYKTAKGALQNLLDTVARYGFVPTGGRVYFTDRSELPLLPLMIKDYYDATHDQAFVAEALPLLQKEYSFWDTYRSSNITYTRNNATSSLATRQNPAPDFVTSKTTFLGPSLFSTAQPSGQASILSSLFLRPELYLQDYVTSKTSMAGPNLFSTSLSNGDFYAASEAGTTPSVQYADLSTAFSGPSLFSTSRRRSLNIPSANPFADFTKDELLVLGTADINNTIAVNLNSILYQSEIIIADFIKLLANNTETHKSLQYRQSASERRQTMIDLAYNPQTGLFSDYHVSTGKHSEIWTINSLWSYWAFADALPSQGSQQALNSLAELHQKFPGGLPNTYYNTTLLWDWPNIQSPMQHMAIKSAAAIEGLPIYRKRAGDVGKGIAAGIAQSTLTSSFCNWYTTGGTISGVLDSYDNASGSSSGVSFGSYAIGADGNIITTTDASDPGDYAWSNGVLLWLYGEYGRDIEIPTCPNIKLNIVQETVSTPPPLPSPSPSPSPSSVPSSAPEPAPTSSAPPPTSCTDVFKCTRCRCRMTRRRRSVRKVPVRRQT
ncbi:hypothetical protein H4R20_002355 [Coemansia guatemalensis]|uniref:alpha,alpha-trehalase n=1 Tax=Coemansia guatemalensis TaxID=2761395 RepID=A0A9W8I2M8_9FUNG|nr:hypothetical protein H4R20_002355 [Coemansia guatemalensis]